MRKLTLIAAATAVALVAGTRAARYLQLQREQPPVMDVAQGYVIPESTQLVMVDTSIGTIMFGPNHQFQPHYRDYQKGNAIFVYLPSGYSFDDEYVQRLSLAFLYATKGHFRMEVVPHIADGGDPNASAIISAGSNNQAYWSNKDGGEPSTWTGTPLAYKYYMGDDPTPNFGQTVELVTWLIEHPRYVEQACDTIGSLIGTNNLSK